MPSSAQSARRSARAAGYVFPEHLREQARALPAQPGVYTFHGREGGLPLYIGKSVNLRTRVLDHLRTEEEAAMLRQSERISHLPMAGDLGAQLLEATMVKTHRPLYNRLLRRVPRQFSLRLYRGEVSVLHSGEVDLTSAPLLYGVYSSERSAREALRRLADDHRLCYSLLGLERLPAGRPCFRSMLGQCLGACCGRESVAEHQRRLSEALALLEVVQWPYAGPVAIEERGPDLRQFHVVDGWFYHGSSKTLAAARRLRRGPAQFDRDAYRILRKGLCSGQWALHPL
ncbi:excinuclease Cho [Stenotrophomonas sp. S48]|uniref:excinuclease Cho n=1 Tax=unclassified Stenotrophomonas TaxID=196198 RepID=UPI001900F571|nr:MULTISPECIES: excinuclease Cho [unclassified Stenotrophomonas]MBK0026264.1 excinuclease Cho [Stenotrophomonas sp. S48]MBK0049062.1 excinuclease Cho [Stenotrophomonas sp. S49]